MEWSLEKHGDSLEQRWYPQLRALFPEYEHVVPLTYRVINPEVKWVRVDLVPELEEFATSHYNVFARLACAARELCDTANLQTPCGFMNFYMHLTVCAKEMLENVCRAQANLARRYGQVELRDVDALGKAHGDPLLDTDRKNLIAETLGYRNIAGHAPALIIIGGKVPRPEFVKDTVTLRDVKASLAQKARIWIKRPSELQTDYVNVVDMTRTHSDQCLGICNRTWKSLAAALSRLDAKYRGDAGNITAVDREHATILKPSAPLPPGFSLQDRSVSY
jgi:hypothetical protein